MPTQGAFAVPNRDETLGRMHATDKARSVSLRHCPQRSPRTNGLIERGQKDSEGEAGVDEEEAWQRE